MNARYEAFVRLLALPDEPCMPPRVHGPMIQAERRTDEWKLKRDLGLAWVEWCRQHWTNGDISRVVNVRKLQLVKRA